MLGQETRDAFRSAAEDAELVSRVQAGIKQVEDNYYLFALRPKNPVILNGKPVEENEALASGEAQGVGEQQHQHRSQAFAAGLSAAAFIGFVSLASLLYADVFGRCYGLSTIGLRYFNVFGPRQDPSSPYSGVISPVTREDPAWKRDSYQPSLRLPRK